MSVQIRIHREGGKVVFDSPSNAQQSDLVFWFNDDSQAHYPVPGCSGLKVAAGASSAQYQPAPDVTSKLPLPIDYVCAIAGHEAEKGTLTVQPDVPPPPLGAPGTNGQSVPINIHRSGGSVVFDTVDVAQIDTVFWRNQDTQAHWPVPNCSGLRVDPGKTSNGLQPAGSTAPISALTSPALPTTGPPPLPASITYGCAIAGHEAERGTINVYDNLAAVPQAPPIPPGTYPTVSPALPYAASIVVTGGKSPYTIVQDPAHPELTIVEMAPAGSSSGVGVVLNTAPKSSGNVTIQVNVTDGLGRKFNQPLTITV